MSLSAGTRLGPYEILALLGAGGMGEVYRAHDARLGRTVAIKILPPHVVDHPTRRQRFEREARAVSRLSHPHICAVYDIGQQDDVLFIVMEYLAGESLADRLKNGALPIAETLRYAIEIADALDHAHRSGVVHRDLKPANIMITASGAKLLDFGVARFRQSSKDEPLEARVTESLTQEGGIVGTLQYMAPEQLEGKETDARTDIFAFGGVTYEMAAGRPAFSGSSQASLIAAILDRDPLPLTSTRTTAGGETATAAGAIPPHLEHVVSRCLAKNPDERWQTAADVRQELKWIAHGGVGSRTPAPLARRRRWVTPLAWAAAAAVIILSAAYGAFRIGRGSNPASIAPTFTQLTFRRGNVTNARFAPDGQTIYYSAAWDGGPVRVFETRSNGPASKALGPAQTGLESVSYNNELALILGCELDAGVCSGTLASMPISGGAPRKVLDDVVSADWTPDGKDLAAIHVSGGESLVEFPIGKRLYGAPGRLESIAFSPLNNKLAFIEHPILAEETGDLKVIDLEGHVTTVSAGWKTIRGIHWSPSGDAIWFTGSRTGKTCSLYAQQLSGELRLILQVPGDMTLWDISKDGRLLLSHGPPRAHMIWASGSKPNEEERDLSWLDWSTVADMSQDGKQLLFHEWGVGVGASPMVYLRDANGSDAVRLGAGKALSLSPDGRWALALLEGDHEQLVLLATGTGQSKPVPMDDLSDVYWVKWFPDSQRLLVVASGADMIPKSSIVDIDTGRRTPIADAGGLAMLVSPDMRQVLVRGPLGGYEMWPVAGGDPTLIPGILPDDRPIQWSAGGMLYLHGGEQDSLRIYRFNMATRRRELWKELKPRDPAGVIGIATGRGEVAITPDGQHITFTYWVVLEDLFLVNGVVR